MAYDQKDNNAVLFKHDKKGNDRAPDYSGLGMVNGKAVRLSACIKEGKNGKFLSLNFQEPYEKKEDKPAPVTQKPQGNFNDFEDDIPF